LGGTTRCGGHKASPRTTATSFTQRIEAGDTPSSRCRCVKAEARPPTKTDSGYVDNLKHMADIAPQDVEIALFESPRIDWGIRGMST
jgi:hypothetical protein